MASVLVLKGRIELKVSVAIFFSEYKVMDELRL